MNLNIPFLALKNREHLTKKSHAKAHPEAWLPKHQTMISLKLLSSQSKNQSRKQLVWSINTTEGAKSPSHCIATKPS